MAARSIASLTLSFGLVNVPVKLYSATESSSAIRFNMLAPDGSRLKQQYVTANDGKVVERADMVKGYEFEKDQFVMFTPEELKAMDEEASHVIDIVAFVPEKSVDAIYYDRAYFLTPDKRGAKPYALLAEAMRESGRCALARWTSRGKQYVVQVRPHEEGLMMQQLLYSEEVRSLKDLSVESADVSPSELKLALQLIEQITQDAFDPAQFKDEEKQRLLQAIDKKIAGQEVVASVRTEPATGAQVINLMDALRASLGKQAGKGSARKGAKEETVPAEALKQRKTSKRAAKSSEAAKTPTRARARK